MPDVYRRALDRAERLVRHKMLMNRRAFGIGCTCPTGPGSARPHHWACGVNGQEWTR